MPKVGEYALAVDPAQQLLGQGLLGAHRGEQRRDPALGQDLGPLAQSAAQLVGAGRSALVELRGGPADQGGQGGLTYAGGSMWLFEPFEQPYPVSGCFGGVDTFGPSEHSGYPAVSQGVPDQIGLAPGPDQHRDVGGPHRPMLAADGSRGHRTALAEQGMDLRGHIFGDGRSGAIDRDPVLGGGQAIPSQLAHLDRWLVVAARQQL